MVLFARLLGYYSGHRGQLDGTWALPLPMSISSNVIGLLFLLFSSIVLNFPSEAPVNSESMNYTSAAIGLVALLSIVTWFTSATEKFTGPSDVTTIDGVVQSQGVREKT